MQNETSHPSPDEHKRAEYEARKKLSDDFRERLDDFHDEQLAAANPDYVSAKPVRQVVKARGDYKRAHHDDDGKADTTLFGSLFGSFVKPGEIISAIGTVISPLFGVTAAPSAPVVTTALSPAGRDYYLDENYEFGTTMVSQQTRRALEEEAEIVAAKMVELRAAKTAPEIERRERELESLADKFEMYLHPVTKLYAHEIGRIARYEEKFNPGNLGCTFEVCAVRIRADIADTRQVKRAIADIYNEDPAEVQLNQSERAAVEARPVLPDGIRSLDI